MAEIVCQYCAETEIRFLHENGMSKRQIKLDREGPSSAPNICHIFPAPLVQYLFVYYLQEVMRTFVKKPPLIIASNSIEDLHSIDIFYA